MTTQAQVSEQLWEQVVQSVTLGPTTINGDSKQKAAPQKSMANNDAEAFFNVCDGAARAAGWQKSQWVVVLISCLIESGQQMVDTLLTKEVTNYANVRKTSD